MKGLDVMITNYKNAGGVGITILKNGKRLAGIDFHKIKDFRSEITRSFR